MSDNNILIGKYVVMFIILTGVGILYEKYKKHNKSIDVKNDYKLIQRYLLNEDALPLGLNKKPILWIHIDREKNARYWDSFYSRGNDCLNQPYINLLVKNIINYSLRCPSLKERLLTREELAKRIKDVKEGDIIIARNLRIRKQINKKEHNHCRRARLVDSVKEKGKGRNKIYETKELADKALIDDAIEWQKNLLEQQQLKHTNSGSSQHS